MLFLVVEGVAILAQFAYTFLLVEVVASAYALPGGRECRFSFGRLRSVASAYAPPVDRVTEQRYMIASSPRGDVAMKAAFG